MSPGPPDQQWLRLRRLNYLNGIAFGVATSVFGLWGVPSAWPNPVAVAFAVVLVVVTATLTVRGCRLGISFTDREVAVHGLARTRTATWDRVKAVVTPGYAVNQRRVVAGFQLTDGTLLISRSIGGSREMGTFADSLAAAASARTRGRVVRADSSE